MGIVFSFLVCSVFIPVYTFRNDTQAYSSNRWDVFTEASLSGTMNWFVTIWVFFFGACLGSFLNVVAYRIPNNLTLLGSSRCPFCFVTIQSKYNFPIIGWFALRGRCADCRLPIAVRYFIVEIIAGLLLLWLFRFELYADGANLPTDHKFEIGRLFRTLSSGNYEQLSNHDWSLVRIFFSHCLVGYTILTAALMKLDSFQIPKLWAAVHLLIVAAVIAIWPADVEFARLVPIDVVLVQRIDVQLFGGMMGLIIGTLFSKLANKPDYGVSFGFTVAGICLGFYALLSMAILFLLIVFGPILISKNKALSQNLLFAVLCSFLIQIGFWQTTNRVEYWPNTNAKWWVTLAYIVIVVAVTLLLNSDQLNSEMQNEAVIDEPDDSSDPTVSLDIDTTARYEIISDDMEN